MRLRLYTCIRVRLRLYSCVRVTYSHPLTIVRQPTTTSSALFVVFSRSDATQTCDQSALPTNTRRREPYPAPWPDALVTTTRTSRTNTVEAGGFRVVIHDRDDESTDRDTRRRYTERIHTTDDRERTEGARERVRLRETDKDGERGSKEDRCWPQQPLTRQYYFQPFSGANATRRGVVSQPSSQSQPSANTERTLSLSVREYHRRRPSTRRSSNVSVIVPEFSVGPIIILVVVIIHRYQCHHRFLRHTTRLCDRLRRA